MIGVYITINGKPIFARTAINRIKERGVYVGDDGSPLREADNSSKSKDLTELEIGDRNDA